MARDFITFTERTLVSSTNSNNGTAGLIIPQQYTAIIDCFFGTNSQTQDSNFSVHWFDSSEQPAVGSQNLVDLIDSLKVVKRGITHVVEGGAQLYLHSGDFLTYSSQHADHITVVISGRFYHEPVLRSSQ